MTYVFKSGSVKITVKASDIDMAYRELDARVSGALELGIEVPYSGEYELYANY